MPHKKISQLIDLLILIKFSALRSMIDCGSHTQRARLSMLRLPRPSVTRIHSSFPCTSFFFACTMTISCFATVAYAQTLPGTVSGQRVMDSDVLGRIEQIVQSGIAEKKMPGCVVCIGRQTQIGYFKAYGHRMLGSDPEPMTTDSVFDLASLTKPIATTTCIMQLIDGGKLHLDDTLANHLPQFGINGKSAITVKDALLHQSGLVADNPLSDYLDGQPTAWTRICELSLVDAVGEKFRYSDVNFIVLGKLVEKLTGQDLHQVSSQTIFEPLHMHDTGFLPDNKLHSRTAATERRDGKWMRGQVHDPRAHTLGGIAGHAGLFSTASDLALFAQALLASHASGTKSEANPILSTQSVQLMTRAHSVSRGTRGLGWDKQSPYSSNRGSQLSASAFGHGGFTGTVIWIDPELDLFVIFLSNRVHPGGTGRINHLAGQIVDLAAQSIQADSRK